VVTDIAFVTPLNRRLVSVTGVTVPIHDHQPVVWMSVSKPDVAVPPNPGRCFPVVLSTGYSHAFLLTVSHLQVWADIALESLPQVGRVEIGEDRIITRAARLWLYKSEPTGEPTKSAAPSPVESPSGIVVCPDDHRSAPRLPVAGVRFLVENGLVLTVDGRTNGFRLRRKGWWPFT
jgi:hypothetical protein